MFDDDRIQTAYNAVLLIKSIREELLKGTLHYRAKDGKLLETEEEILETLQNGDYIATEIKMVSPS